MSITYKEFKDLASPYLATKYVGYNKPEEVLEKFQTKWRVGGLQGGNCWGGYADQGVEADNEPDLDTLDHFIEKYFPSLSFLQYKRLMKLIKTDDETNYEYYGNYYIYRYKFLELKDLYDFLDGEGLVGSFTWGDQK